MATKAARGTKRTCQNEECGSRFYDLNRDPIVCPICQSHYVIASAPSIAEAVAAQPEEKPARKAKIPEPVEASELPVVEVPEGEDALTDVEVAEEPAAVAEDETYLEEEEEEGGDVSNIIGGPVAEDQEES
jgi:uncharacterized protein (TIGR02300 family)